MQVETGKALVSYSTSTERVAELLPPPATPEPASTVRSVIAVAVAPPQPTPSETPDPANPDTHRRAARFWAALTLSTLSQLGLGLLLTAALDTTIVLVAPAAGIAGSLLVAAEMTGQRTER